LLLRPGLGSAWHRLPGTGSDRNRSSAGYREPDAPTWTYRRLRSETLSAKQEACAAHGGRHWRDRLNHDCNPIRSAPFRYLDPLDGRIDLSAHAPRGSSELQPCLFLQSAGRGDAETVAIQQPSVRRVESAWHSPSPSSPAGSWPRRAGGALDVERQLLPARKGLIHSWPLSTLARSFRVARQPSRQGRSFEMQRRTGGGRS